MKLSHFFRACFLSQIANCRTSRVQGSGFRIQIRAGHFSAQCDTASGFPHPSSLIPHPSAKKNAAFSILEVILALAILTGAMAVLGELGRLGFQNAKAAQDLTKAQMLCESKMAEYTSGITTPQAVSATPFDAIDQDSNNSTTWVYSVDLQQIDQDGLDALCVTVTQNLPAAQHPISYSITRWITDPSVGQSTSTDSTSTQGSTTSTSGTGN
jgi:type II secretory pathway pseudopilin PulG